MLYLNYTVSLEPLIAVIVGVFNYQQLRDKLSKPFLVYLFSSINSLIFSSELFVETQSAWAPMPF
jgi:hypothetical protein